MDDENGTEGVSNSEMEKSIRPDQDKSTIILVRPQEGRHCRQVKNLCSCKNKLWKKRVITELPYWEKRAILNTRVTHFCWFIRKLNCFLNSFLELVNSSDNEVGMDGNAAILKD